MSSMTDSETHNGYANRETWAFNLHWQNDQGLYNMTLERAQGYLDGLSARREVTDYELGEDAVAYWQDTIGNWRNVSAAEDAFANTLAMFRDEVGSWWRIDYAEVGAAVRESLDAEGDGA